DALDLPFDDASFDTVVCQFGIMFFPDKAKGMREMTRVLKPGGTLALNVWNDFSRNPSVGIVDEVIKSFFTEDPPRFLEIPFGGVDTSTGRTLFEEAGLTKIEITTISEPVASHDHADAARGFITGNPTILEIQNRATVDAEEIVRTAAEALEKAYGPAPVELTFEATVFLGRK
ncbi:MAG: methyltransferase domain-containing protein, partial [Rhodospirillaceae bacterium]|nr:methyltransferase domain-containing protein [Rhodospirillaceae bacterium]